MNHQINVLKQHLVDAIRMLEMMKHIDFNGHVSVRIPKKDWILINSATASRRSLTEEDIIAIDLQGNVMEGNRRPPNEYPLHTQIYKRRKDIQAIAHTHPQWSTLFTITQTPLRPVIIQGATLGQIQVFQKSHSISNFEIADELAEKLGEYTIVLLKAHGAVITGETIIETFVRSVFLEENAYRQYMASHLGYAHSLDKEEIETMIPFLWRPQNVQKVWDYYRSKLENRPCSI